MMKKILFVLAYLFIALSVDAQSKLTPYTLSFLNNYTESRAKSTRVVEQGRVRLYAEVNTKNTIATIGAFVTLTEGADIDALVALGVEVYGRAGNMLTVEVPVDKIVTISELEEVKRVDVEKPVKLLNDRSRVLTGVDRVYAGTNLDRAYTGAGVIVGICDSGIDFNHIAFMDASGKSRVKRAYLLDESGIPPAGTASDGGKFRGAVYETPEKISKLKTDNEKTSHGSHTANIAAGSYAGNNFYGNAKGSDLVLCGMKNLTDLNIANSVLYTFNYAESVNKPAVINLSMGGNNGAHDGTSSITQYLDELSGEGRIITISAGNSGARPLYITKTFADKKDELKTFLLDNTSGSRGYWGYVDAWSRTNDAIGIKAIIYNRKTGKILYETVTFNPKSGNSSGNDMIFSSSAIPGLARYYEGYIRFWAGIDSQNGKYNSWCEFILRVPDYETSIKEPDYSLGLIYTADTGVQMDVWADDDNTVFADYGIEGWTAGTSACSISDMATGNNTITVGSYNSKYIYQAINGKEYAYSELCNQLNKISSFSSYGPDLRGIKRPDVVAPGALVVSAVNGYDKSTVNDSHDILADEISGSDRKYQWGAMMGTSMSAPAVAGIIALWLEADRTLTPKRIKEILQETSIKDADVTGGNPDRWGAGKINAYAGLVKILRNLTGTEKISNSNKVIVSPIVDGRFKVYAPGETGQVTVNIYSSNGTLLYSTTQFNGGEVEVKVEGLNKNGVNIMQVLGDKTNFRAKLVF